MLASRRQNLFWKLRSDKIKMCSNTCTLALSWRVSKLWSSVYMYTHSPLSHLLQIRRLFLKKTASHFHDFCHTFAGWGVAIFGLPHIIFWDLDPTFWKDLALRSVVWVLNLYCLCGGNGTDHQPTCTNQHVMLHTNSYDTYNHSYIFCCLRYNQKRSGCTALYPSPPFAKMKMIKPSASGYSQHQIGLIQHNRSVLVKV